MNLFITTSIKFEGHDLRFVQNSAFRGIRATRIDFPEGLESLGNTIFTDSTYIQIVSIPSTVTSVSPSVFGYAFSIQKVIVHENCSVLMTNEEGIVFDKEETEIYFFPKDIQKFKVPKGIISIIYGDLRNAESLIILETEVNHSKYNAIDNVLYSNDN